MSKHRSNDELEQLWADFDRPEPGQRFEHYKGGHYEIIATGFLEDTEAPCVVYRSLAKGGVWVRTAKNFLEDIEHEGAVRPRFRPIG